MSTTQGSSSFSSLGYTQTASRPAFNERDGQTWQIEYEGTHSAIASLASSLQSAGGRVAIDKGEGRSRLTVDWAKDPTQPASAEVPWDRWRMDVEEERVSLFNSPLAVAEANAYVNVAQYRTDIEEAAKGGDAFPLSETDYPVGRVIYNLLTQGVETWPIQHPTLSRTRTYTTAYPGEKWQVSLQGFVYTRAALLRVFGIVDPLASRIPFDPSVALPVGFVWGWYLTAQNFEYTVERGAMKVTETISFRHGRYNAYPSGASLTGVNVLIT
jgi:hypothetical protein